MTFTSWAISKGWTYHPKTNNLWSNGYTKQAVSGEKLFKIYKDEIDRIKAK